MCILASIPTAWMTHERRYASATLLLLLSGIGIAGSFHLRRGVADAEWTNRLAPAIAVREIAAQSGVPLPILTMEPLVQQLVSPPDSFIVSLPALTREHVLRMGDEFLYVEHDNYNNPVDRARYSQGFDSLPPDRRLLRAGDGWRIWRLAGEHRGNYPRAF